MYRRGRVLFISNGHGEDQVACAIARALRDQDPAVAVEAAPLVGTGAAYGRLGIPVVAPAVDMPSGGFLYMDPFGQLPRDLRAGLLPTLRRQWRGVAAWSEACKGGLAVAVGDILPLAFAAHAPPRAVRPSTPYAFVGCAKSQHYLADVPLDDDSATDTVEYPHARPWVERALAPRSVYLPWEVAHVANRRCVLACPRDAATTRALALEVARRRGDDASHVRYLGNPMLDIAAAPPTGGVWCVSNDASQPTVTIAVLPGTRPGEAPSNLRRCLRACASFAASAQPSAEFLLPLPPAALPWHTVRSCLLAEGWRRVGGNAEVYVTQHGARLHASAHPAAFGDAIALADGGIAAAGTATEQLCARGVPVAAVPGDGPQFTDRFAEAQCRLLGSACLLYAPDFHADPRRAGLALASVLRDPGLLRVCRLTARARSGSVGSSSPEMASALLSCLP